MFQGRSRLETALIRVCFIRLARISMWISLARIYAPGHRIRQLALGLSFVYGLVGVLLVLLGAFGCKGSAGGTRQRVDYCYSRGQGRTSFEKITMGSVVGKDLDTSLSY